MANTNIEQEIYDLEKRYWQAMIDNDTDTIMSLTGSCRVFNMETS